MRVLVKLPVYIELDINVAYSAVDSYIQSGYIESRDLTDEELDRLQEELAGEIHQYSMENGSRERK